MNSSKLSRRSSFASSLEDSVTSSEHTPKSLFVRTPLLDNVSIFDLLDPSFLTLDFKRRTDDTYKWVKDVGRRAGSSDLDKLKQVLHSRIDKAYTRIDNLQSKSSTEKLFFSMSVYFIFIMGFVVGNCPNYIHIIYSAVMGLLLPVRFITYYKIGFGYYLADLCYYVNFLLLLYIWVFPQSKMLFIACCSFSWGTVSFAVITWKNKLVLHSVEKITSTAIHVFPGIIMYVITHQLDPAFKAKRFPGSVKLEQWNFWQGIFYTSIMYFIWQLSYHYFITIRKAEKIKKGKVTSFEYLRKAFATTPLGRLVNSLPEPFPVVAFTFIQYGYQLGTMSLCPLLYKYKILCSLFVSFIFLTAVYNGATYYVDFYGKKFQKEVVKLQKEIEELNNEKVTSTSPNDFKSTLDPIESTPVTISDIIES